MRLPIQHLVRRHISHPLGVGGEISVKRGSESEIDRGNVAAKYNNKQGRRRRGCASALRGRYATERAVNAMGIVIVLIFAQLAR